MMVEYKLYVGQILVQAGLTGMYIIVRIAFDNGMNRFVYVAYRQAVATLVMAPIAYFLERNDRPPMTCTIFWQIFLIALSGISVSQNLFFIGLAYTSATFTAAIINVLPIVTSVMAIAFRMSSAFTFFVQTYTIKERGPIFPSLFNPLSAIIVAVLELTIFHASLHVGSVVGGVLTIAGLYIALWGKANDKEETRPIEDEVEDGTVETK
ncbi:WAT1-related protein At1g21890-like isoform X4 [Cryptomeria japonica]|uniref:WAT1-related protein At1g21890-like isoform X4 n=1 Tax=Cryptomeria japonica TaxID=3369 RepID=UPI0025AC8B56|nr:WAT1-related protein At1g21890-like isoform X4 [Cryptomeria japonica]